MICTLLLSGYALDPSLDNHQVSAKYIGSVEEAEKNQGNEREGAVTGPCRRQAGGERALGLAPGIFSGEQVEQRRPER